MIGNMAEKLRNQVWDGYNFFGPFHIEDMEMTHIDDKLIIKYTTGSFSPDAARLEVKRMINRIHARHSFTEVKKE